MYKNRIASYANLKTITHRVVSAKNALEVFTHSKCMMDRRTKLKQPKNFLTKTTILLMRLIGQDRLNQGLFLESGRRLFASYVCVAAARWRCMHHSLMSLCKTPSSESCSFYQVSKDANARTMISMSQPLCVPQNTHFKYALIFGRSTVFRKLVSCTRENRGATFIFDDY